MTSKENFNNRRAENAAREKAAVEKVCDRRHGVSAESVLGKYRSAFSLLRSIGRSVAKADVLAVRHATCAEY